MTGSTPQWRSAAQARARYYVPMNHFTERAPRAGGQVFDAERQAALSGTRSGVVVLDRAATLGLPFAATTPTMLASYVVLHPGQPLAAPGFALACICYVIRGSGVSSGGDQTVHWDAGDVFVLPADRGIHHEATQHALLYSVTDEPFWRYLGVRELRALAPSAVHYPAHATAREMERLDELDLAESVGRAVIFTRDGWEESHVTTPILIANINTLEPGADQRTHRHNGAALTLSIQGDGCHSVVDGQRLDWAPHGVMVTPAGLPHSHHNRGNRLMVSWVVQDSGLYQYTGVHGFSFDPDREVGDGARIGCP